ncbi:MAG: type II toxin-antitoxin system prevent-host-death family antitoxin [Clostridiales bacterium]|nr:type II toxin-antitoxin system prevent-host-death family antitoxin [Clostridiales bacterium]
MPTIKSSADLRNGYNDISNFCHEYNEPVFITKNGKGDLAVMSIETYDKLVGRFELYNLINEGLSDIEKGDVIPASDAISSIRKRRKNEV